MENSHKGRRFIFFPEQVLLTSKNCLKGGLNGKVNRLARNYNRFANGACSV